MSKYLSKRFAGLETYTPGEQPADERLIKLNTNESPYPPAPGVAKILNAAEINKLNLYPDPDGSRLISKLAGFYGVRPENIIIGNGSDELLAFAFLAFCDSGRGMMFPDVTYGFYRVYSQLFGIPAIETPLKDDFTIDPASYMNAGSNIVIANPNAPTGVALPLSGIEAIVRGNREHIVLVDEAYVDFGTQSAIRLISELDNLLVIHTFSKSRSMAGARLAYAIGQPPLIEDLNKMKYSFNPYNVNRLTQLAGEAALDEEAYYRDRRREIVETREYTKSRLAGLGFEMTDSAANFVFARRPDIEGGELYAALKRRGILVRHFDKPRVSDYLRITIGTRAQMETLLRILDEIL